MRRTHAYKSWNARFKNWRTLVRGRAVPPQIELDGIESAAQSHHRKRFVLFWESYEFHISCDEVFDPGA